jgi:hypothetical protein
VTCHRLTDLGNHSGGLVPQHQRLLHHERADAPVLVVVHVGAAHADGADIDADLVRSGPWVAPLLEAHVAGRVEDGRQGHRVSRTAA